MGRRGLAVSGRLLASTEWGWRWGAVVSAPEELEAREAATRRRVEALRAEAAESALTLEAAQEDPSRWEITRETVMRVLAELSAAETDPEAEVPVEPGQKPPPHGAGVVMVPDVYRDIGRPWGPSTWRSSCGLNQVPSARVQRPVRSGSVTASSRRTTVRVLQPSWSASIQCRNFSRL